MDANIKTPQDALEWLDRSIREEAELDGETSNAHAIQLGFIQNMLAKFPRRNCDVYTADELKTIFKSELVSQLPIANEHEKNLVTITAMGVIDTLFAPATEKEGGAE
jgi:hypothetical protein